MQSGGGTNITYIYFYNVEGPHQSLDMGRRPRTMGQGKAPPGSGLAMDGQCHCQGQALQVRDYVP
jgi:hypothetical protein